MTISRVVQHNLVRINIHNVEATACNGTKLLKLTAGIGEIWRPVSQIRGWKKKPRFLKKFFSGF